MCLNYSVVNVLDKLDNGFHKSLLLFNLICLKYSRSVLALDFLKRRQHVLFSFPILGKLSGVEGSIFLGYVDEASKSKNDNSHCSDIYDTIHLMLDKQFALKLTTSLYSTQDSFLCHQDCFTSAVIYSLRSYKQGRESLS
jgi:hypothetical protein